MLYFSTDTAGVSIGSSQQFSPRRRQKTERGKLSPDNAADISTPVTLVIFSWIEHERFSQKNTDGVTTRLSRGKIMDSTAAKKRGSFCSGRTEMDNLRNEPRSIELDAADGF